MKIRIENAHIMDSSTGWDAFGDLYLADGLLCEGAADFAADAVLDAAGLIAAPGLVDLHVHLRDPGQTEKEDFASGAAAAAAGGVTTLVAMPNTAPPMDNAALLAETLQRAAMQPINILQAACVSQGLGEEAAVDFAALAAAGAAAFSDDGKPIHNAGLLKTALLEAQKYGVPLLAHCEELSLAQGGLVNSGAAKTLGVRALPPAAEDVGTAREVMLAWAEGLPVHICHVSTKTSLALLCAAKADGAPVTAETAPHYFSLDENALTQRDANLRMNPPLRSAEDVAAVIAALQDGTIDAIATDHAPHTPAQKADFDTAPNGIIGMETSLSAGITYLVNPGHISLMRLLDLMSSSPAKILGREKQAGSLQPGFPADIVLFDPQEKWEIRAQDLHGKSQNCPYIGKTLLGRVKYTICNGKIIYKEN